MNCREAVRLMVLGMAMVAVAPSGAMSQDTSSLMNQSLDQPVKVQFDTVLPEAMTQITRITGVRVEAEAAVWELLPWGQQTNIQAKIENQTLRQAMDAITRKLALTYVMRDDVLQLQPAPALRRVGRRATIQELQALDVLTAQSLGLAQDRVTVKQLVDAVDQKLAAAKSTFAMEYRPGDAIRPDKTVFVPRNATMADALEAIVKETPLTWYPWGKTIVVVPKEEQVRNQLAKTITMRFAGVDVAQVLTELSQRAGVRFEIEPGALQRVPAEVRNVQLMLDNSSVMQALESVAGFTGLGYVVTPRGVYIWNQSYGDPSGRRDRVVGLMSLPDVGIQAFIFDSQVPPDMKEYLKMHREKEFEKVRQLMQEQGFRPTTSTTSERPAATEPGAEDL